MFEPIVQDYIRIAIELDRESFTKKLGVPLLIATTTRAGKSFQQARTRLMEEGEQNKLLKRAVKFNHHAAVLEVRPADSARAGDVRVGRAEENDLVLDEEEVSAQHAVFRWEGGTGRYSLQDLESTNGTSINKTQLVPGRAVELKNGDLLNFGNVAFVFFYPGGFYDAITKQL